VSVASWTAYDEGFLRAYEWAGALAGGAAMPQETTAAQLGPGEVSHALFAAVGFSGYFGEDKQYRAASLAHNASKKAEARRAAIPHWHPLGTADIVVTNQRLVVTGNGQTGSFWYAEASPLQMAAGMGGIPAVQFQPAGQPPLRLESAWAPLLWVFVHYLVDGRAPAVPLQAGLLERAEAQGRLRRRTRRARPTHRGQ